MEGFVYCKVTVSPVRAAASDCAEIVTQLLFGEVAEIIGSDQQWLHIRSWLDNYEGWIDGKQVHALSKKEVNRWLDGQETEHSLVRKIQTPWGIQRITRGAFVPASGSNAFNIGHDQFEFLDEPDPLPAHKLEYALEFLNTPYLWGGKTPFGIDCSGFMQTVHRFVGINLPRDASQQAETGLNIPFEDREPGDLAFFQNKDGKINHVGLLLEKDSIIHASGWVRIDTFTPEGIVRNTDGELSHPFYGIKRL